MVKGSVQVPFIMVVFVSVCKADFLLALVNIWHCMCMISPVAQRS